MRPAEVLKRMVEMREAYRHQSFSFSREQQAEYDRLLKLRRERVQYMHKNGMVHRGGTKKSVPNP